MSYQVISTTLPTAKKEHKCIWCGESILINELHAKDVGVYECDFQSNRYHIECYNASHTYFKESGENCFEPYDNKRGSTEEKSNIKLNSLLEELTDKNEECNICSGSGSPVCDCMYKEKCNICGKSWSPSLIESGTCIFCIVKEKNKMIDQLITERNALEDLNIAYQKQSWDKEITHMKNI